MSVHARPLTDLSRRPSPRPPPTALPRCVAGRTKELRKYTVGDPNRAHLPYAIRAPCVSLLDPCVTFDGPSVTSPGTVGVTSYVRTLTSAT